jgi:hypothetical protein
VCLWATTALLRPLVNHYACNFFLLRVRREGGLELTGEAHQLTLCFSWRRLRCHHPGRGCWRRVRKRTLGALISESAVVDNRLRNATTVRLPFGSCYCYAPACWILCNGRTVTEGLRWWLRHPLTRHVHLSRAGLVFTCSRFGLGMLAWLWKRPLGNVGHKATVGLSVDVRSSCSAQGESLC